MDRICPFRLRNKGKRESFCHKIIEMHPVCFWVTWVSTTLLSLLSVMCFTGYVNWKICAYSAFILACIIIFIVAAIVHLRQFGKELQVNLGYELDEAMCGHNRYDRPDSSLSQVDMMETPVKKKTGSTVHFSDIGRAQSNSESSEFTQL